MIWNVAIAIGLFVLIRGVWCFISLMQDAELLPTNKEVLSWIEVQYIRRCR